MDKGVEQGGRGRGRAGATSGSHIMAIQVGGGWKLG